MNSSKGCRITLTFFDKLVVSFSYLILLAIWVLQLLAFPSTLYLSICIIATILFIGLSLLLNYPHRFNYPVRISERNSIKQYQLAVRFLLIFRFSILLLFLGIGLLSNIKMEYSPLGAITLVLLLMILPIIVYILKAIRLG